MTDIYRYRPPGGLVRNKISCQPIAAGTNLQTVIHSFDFSFIQIVNKLDILDQKDVEKEILW